MSDSVKLGVLGIVALLFLGLGAEGLLDHDRLSEAMSGAGVIGAVVLWFIRT